MVFGHQWLKSNSEFYNRVHVTDVLEESVWVLRGQITYMSSRYRNHECFSFFLLFLLPFFEMLHGGVAYYRREWRTHYHSILLLVKICCVLGSMLFSFTRRKKFHDKFNDQLCSLLYRIAMMYVNEINFSSSVQYMSNVIRFCKM